MKLLDKILDFLLGPSAPRVDETVRTKEGFGEFFGEKKPAPTSGQKGK